MSTVLSTELFVPAAIAFITGFALYKKTDVFASFTKGAKEGLASAVSILPALCFLMTAVGMLRQSGFVEMLTGFVSPLAEKIGFPPEVLPLAFLRPFPVPVRLDITAKFVKVFRWILLRKKSLPF